MREAEEARRRRLAHEEALRRRRAALERPRFRLSGAKRRHVISLLRKRGWTDVQIRHLFRTIRQTGRAPEWFEMLVRRLGYATEKPPFSFQAHEVSRVSAPSLVPLETEKARTDITIPRLEYQLKAIEIPRLLTLELRLLEKQRRRQMSYQFNPFAVFITSAQKAVQGANVWFTRTVQPSLTQATRVMQNIGQNVVAARTNILNTASRISTNIQQTVGRIGGTVYQNVRNLWNQTAAAAQQMWNRFQAGLVEFGKKFSQAVGSLGNAGAAVQQGIALLSGVIGRSTSLLNRINRLKATAQPRFIPRKLEFAIDRHLAKMIRIAEPPAMQEAVEAFITANRRPPTSQGELRLWLAQVGLSRRFSYQAPPRGNIAGRIQAIRTQRAQLAHQLREIASKKQALYLQAAPIQSKTQAILVQAQAKLQEARGKAGEVERHRGNLMNAQRQVQTEQAQLTARVTTSMRQVAMQAARIPRPVGRFSYDHEAMEEMEEMVASFREDALSYDPVIPLLIIIAIAVAAAAIATWAAIQVVNWANQQNATLNDHESRITALESQVTQLTQQEDQLTKQLQAQDAQIADLQTQLAQTGGGPGVPPAPTPTSVTSPPIVPTPEYIVAPGTEIVPPPGEPYYSPPQVTQPDYQPPPLPPSPEETVYPPEVPTVYPSVGPEAVEGPPPPAESFIPQAQPEYMTRVGGPAEVIPEGGGLRPAPGPEIEAVAPPTEVAPPEVTVERLLPPTEEAEMPEEVPSEEMIPEEEMPTEEEMTGEAETAPEGGEEGEVIDFGDF